MKRQYKKSLIILVMAIVMASQSLIAFAATTTVPKQTKDTDFWWNGWEDYSYVTNSITLSYTNGYSLDSTNVTTDYWWTDNVQFRCVTTTYNWRVY